MTQSSNLSKRRMNPETKAIVSWIRRRPRTYRRMANRAFDFLRKARASATSTATASDSERDANDLATALAVIFEVDSPLADRYCVFADLLACALHRVDWHELAAKLLCEQERKISNG